MGQPNCYYSELFCLHYIIFRMLVRILLFLSTLTIFMTLVKGHCCGHCVPGLCSCAGQPSGCDADDSPSCPPSNSHLCCAPQKCGDCNLFCCECSCCCSAPTPALDKWNALDLNNDLKLDRDEITLYLGNGSLDWIKHAPQYNRLVTLFMDKADANSNGAVDPWEMDSSLGHLGKNGEL